MRANVSGQARPATCIRAAPICRQSRTEVSTRVSGPLPYGARSATPIRARICVSGTRKDSIPTPSTVIRGMGWNDRPWAKKSPGRSTDFNSASSAVLELYVTSIAPPRPNSVAGRASGSRPFVPPAVERQ